MYYDKMREGVRSAYCERANIYRQHDEIETRTDHHCWIWKTLADLSGSFGREISALDAGCGTGRYFHCVQNVERLTGLDISPEMLEVAEESPVRQELISAKKIELICGDIHSASFPEGSFDFIYSMGMFGYGCPLTLQVLRKFYDWLTDEGLIVFDVPHVASLSGKDRLLKWIKRTAYPMLPGGLQRRLDERESRLPFFVLSMRQLSRLMCGSEFGEFKLYSRPVNSPAWGDQRMECVAGKELIHAELVAALDYRLACLKMNRG